MKIIITLNPNDLCIEKLPNPDFVKVSFETDVASNNFKILFDNAEELDDFIDGLKPDRTKIDCGDCGTPIQDDEDIYCEECYSKIK
jgi:hypothetical protein